MNKIIVMTILLLNILIWIFLVLSWYNFLNWETLKAIYFILLVIAFRIQTIESKKLLK